MKIITHIYKDFANEISSTYEFRRSCDHFGYEVINTSTGPKVNFGEVLRLCYEGFKTLGDEMAMYADGADTFFLRPLDNTPEDRITYMTEKQIWPPTESMRAAWAGQPPPTSMWPYLNGGAYCGPASLIVEYYEKYGLSTTGAIEDAHSQRLQTEAYMRASKDGFPIELDDRCKFFQTIGFTNDGDFMTEGNLIHNNRTGTYPALFHGNGRTAMGWVYECLSEGPNVEPVQHKPNYETR